MEIVAPIKTLSNAPNNAKPLNKKPKVKIASTTIYRSSYLDHADHFNRQRALPVKSRKNLSNISKIDFNTVHKLSYKELHAEPVTLIIPKSRLAFTGPRELSSTYTKSYSDYTFTKTFPYKPHARKICNSAPMYLESVMKKSYSHPGKTEKIHLSHRRQFWQTSFKTDYKSVNQLSYSDPKVLFPKKVRRRTQRIPISIKMDCNTTYRMSY